MNAKWTQAEAIALCVKIEAVAPEFGCHVALSGGCLYKEGDRKDADIILYRIRQSPKIDFDGLFDALELIGVRVHSGFGFCHKAEYRGRRIDFLSPEERDGDYEHEEIDPADKLTTDDLLR